MNSPGFSRGEVIFGLGLLCAGALALAAAGENVTRAAAAADAASDLRGLAAAGFLHVADQNRLLPPYNPKDVITGEVAGWNARSNKVATLRPYLESVSTLINIGDAFGLTKNPSDIDAPSYGMNNQLNRSRVLELSQVRNPEQMVWFAESGHLGNGEREKKGAQSFAISGNRPLNESGVFARRDGVSAFVVYFDGRVELIPNIRESEVAAPMLSKDPKEAFRKHWAL
jgi:hypothetical protein